MEHDLLGTTIVVTTLVVLTLIFFYFLFNDEKYKKEQDEHNCFEEFMENKMTLKEHDCQTVSCCTQLEFEETVSKLLNEGYEISSSSCNSSRDWKAILVK